MTAGGDLLLRYRHMFFLSPVRSVKALNSATCRVDRVLRLLTNISLRLEGKRHDRITGRKTAFNSRFNACRLQNRLGNIPAGA